MTNSEKDERDKKDIREQTLKNLKAITSGYKRNDTVPCSGSLLYDAYMLIQDEAEKE